MVGLGKFTLIGRDDLDYTGLAVPVKEEEEETSAGAAMDRVPFEAAVDDHRSPRRGGSGS